MSAGSVSSEKDKTCYRFGDFELDVDAFALRRGDEVLPVQPKALDVLRYLIEHRGRMVPKTELLDELWRGEYVGDAVIAWSVSHIRRALGQQRGEKRPIETVHGRGYRFVAEVSSGASPASLQRAVVAVRPSTATTLIGRDHVMSELQRHLQLAASGHGGLYVITGEAGIGKTRCGTDLVAIAAASGVMAISGRCLEDLGTPPLWPILSALTHLGSEHAEVVARARKLMTAAGDGDGPGDSARSEGEGARFWRAEQVTRLLRELTAAAPLLLFLDDLHWADADTLRLLGFIAPDLHSLPLCVVATLRDGEFDHRTQDDSHTRVLRHAQLIPLGSLDRDEVAELVATLAGRTPSPALADAVRRAAGGIPLFVQEVVRTLILEHGDQAFDTLSPDAVRVPPLARDLLRQRIRRLPDDTIELLSRAAVIGESFDLSLLAALLEVEPDALLDRLEPACAGDHLQSEAPHRYRFVHSLFRTVLYEELPAGQRMAVHRRVGELLAGRADGEAPEGVIARHYYLSLPVGEHAEVTRRAREAGQNAMRAFAFEDAIVYLEWALEAESFAGAADPGTRAEILLSLAVAQRSAGRTGDAMKTTARLIELAQQHDRHDLVVSATRLRRPSMAMASVPDGIARSALEAVLQRVPDTANAAHVSALAQLAWLPPFERDLSRSKDLSARAVALAERQPDRETLFEALRARLFALSGPADMEESLQVAERTLALDAQGPSSWQSGDARVARFSAYLLAGRMADADTALEQMAAAIRGPHWGEAKFYCERLRAQRCFLAGRFDEAEQRWNLAYAGAVRVGVAYAGVFRRTHMLYLALEREGAKQVMRRTVSSMQSLQHFLPPFRAGLIRIAAEAGDTAFVRAQLPGFGDPGDHPRDGGYLNLLANLSVCAAATLDEARCERLFSLLSPHAALNTPDAMGYYLGSASHFLGLLTTVLERTEQAERFFVDALEHNHAMGYRAGVVRTLVAHGRLEQKLGRASQARALFERAQAQAREIGMQGMVQDLEGALAER